MVLQRADFGIFNVAQKPDRHPLALHPTPATPVNAVLIWNEIDADDYATHERSLGLKISRIDDVSWRRVRPFFYRPLCALQEIVPGTVSGPVASSFGAYQHAVPAGACANSHLNYLVFDRLSSYSLGSLNSERRRRIKRATGAFAIKRLVDVEKFKREAYPVYLDFVRRTGYAVGAHRQGETGFARWAENLFQLSGLMILGAYREGVLAGVSTSFRHRNTLSCATLICAADSLAYHLPDLMLHVIRENAARCAGLTEIFPGMYHGNTSLDAFYFERGARILRKPAWLQMNPIGRSVLNALRPEIVRQLLGELTAEEMKRTTGQGVDRHRAEGEPVAGAAAPWSAATCLEECGDTSPL